MKFHEKNCEVLHCLKKKEMLSDLGKLNIKAKKK